MADGDDGGVRARMKMLKLAEKYSILNMGRM